MSLSAYNRKRRFSETPEPEGKPAASGRALRFVVQKHDASSLHYDFRLEMEGVLKSWAVPKGPSLNPADKRLAMQVEDHPLSYRTFEGVIPEGNYGGGTVIVWDEGTYTLEGGNGSRKEQEAALLQGLASGSLRLNLQGQKLKGSFSLRQLKGRDERAWLLVKKKDAEASTEDIIMQDQSVKSGRTIAEIAALHGTVPHHPEAKRATAKGGKKAKAAAAKEQPKEVLPRQKKRSATAIKALLGASAKAAVKASMPLDTKPMLASLINAPFDSADWLFEIKWDGYRALAYCAEDEVSIISRNKKPFTEKYAPVTAALQSLQLNAVIDGEIVAVNEKGLADFQALQNWKNTPVRLQFFVFDILWLGGHDLTGLPLEERKRILQELLPEDHPVIRYSGHVVEKGKDFFEVALSQGLEGIMAKRLGSPYLPGSRTDDWVKIKVNLRQEVVIAGFTAPRKTRKFFGSLLLGVYDGKELVYVGHTGSGFNRKSLESIYNQLQPLVTEKSPFGKAPKANMPATWVKPVLVCEIKFTEWTKDRMARHPIFMGLRVDKKAKDVHFEKAILISAAKEEGNRKGKGAGERRGKGKGPSFAKASEDKERVKGQEGLIDPAAGSVEIVLNGYELQLTNLSKLYWKKEGFSKGDMINYYLQVAPYLLPYLQQRPMSLNRHPNGIDAPNFFQKDMRGKLPEWMQTHEDFSESTGKKIEYLVCSNEASLIYMANLGCIELNPWLSRSASWQQPDWCLIDLDPDKGNTFEQVMEVAKVVKEVLDAIGATAAVKTSGSSGIHIGIPLGARYSFEQSRRLAELIVTIVNGQLPELTSIERSPAKRKGQIYLDYLQNRETQTAAAPYSLRPKPGVPVSTPLHWSELKKGLTPTTWNARNIFERLKAEGDLFSAVLGKGVPLEKLLSKLEKQFT
jgi:bifunctional non-homologous end joining protein LigD